MTLFVTPDQLKQFTPISSSVEVELLYPFLNTAQSMFVQPILGLALYTQIEKEISGQTLTPANTNLLNDWICPFMSWKTFSQAVPFLSMKSYKRSLVKPAGVDTTALTLDELKFYKQNINDIAGHYEQGMINLLADDEAHGSPLYPLYRVQGSNEQRTLAGNNNGMYFRVKVSAGAQTAAQSYPNSFPFYPFYGGGNY